MSELAFIRALAGLCFACNMLSNALKGSHDLYV